MRIPNTQMKALRKRLGVTQARAAKLASIPQKTYENWEATSQKEYRPVSMPAYSFYNLLDLVVNEIGVPLDVIEKALAQRMRPDQD